jgi:hypothetical protein
MPPAISGTPAVAGTPAVSGTLAVAGTPAVAGARAIARKLCTGMNSLSQCQFSHWPLFGTCTPNLVWLFP